MKAFFFCLLLVVFAIPSNAQTTTGTILYTRTFEMKSEDLSQQARAMNFPTKMEDDYELLFDKDQSFYRASLVPDDINASAGGGGGMMRMRRMMGGGDTYHNFSTQTRVQQNELGEDVFVITDSVPPQQWKLTNETKEILGFTCRKATTTREFKRMKMETVNGQPTRKEITDTAAVEAWYAEAIPVPSGPEFAGTLPGMILELSMNDGMLRYVATDIRKKYEKKALVPPTGTPITREEFDEKRNAFFKAMREQWRGGGGH